MITLPVVTVVGTLTADPEVRFTQSGVAFANFTLACNERRKDPQTGEWVDGEATFVRGNIWRDYAEHVAESLRKGQRVFALGQLKQRSYEKDGETRTVFELAAEEMGPVLRFATAVVSKAGRSSGGNGGSAGRQASQRPSGGGFRSPPVPVPGDDEPPF